MKVTTSPSHPNPAAVLLGFRYLYDTPQSRPVLESRFVADSSLRRFVNIKGCLLGGHRGHRHPPRSLNCILWVELQLALRREPKG